MKQRILSIILVAAILLALPITSFADDSLELAIANGTAATDFAKQAIEDELTKAGYTDISFAVFDHDLYNTEDTYSYFTDINYNNKDEYVKSNAMTVFTQNGDGFNVELLVVGPTIYINAQLPTAMVDIPEVAVDTPTTAPETFDVVKKGSKGDIVVEIQERLKELGYLSGEADGSYGNQSVSAVSEFQSAANLSATGEVDKETYDALMSSDAPASANPVVDDSQYETMDYKAIARNPDSHVGDLIKFTGSVIQVMEGDGYNQYRIASKGGYDNIVYVEYTLPAGASRILEDDDVTVYGMCLGVYSYETVLGATVTLPCCLADKIDIK